MDSVGIRSDETSAPTQGNRVERAPGRVVIERVRPEMDGGRFPIKRTVGEQVTVSAEIFADGHDLLAGVVKYRGQVFSDPPAWQEVPLTARGDDRWEGTFTVNELGEYEYTVEAWVDRFRSWLKDLIAKADAGHDVSSELLEGAELIQAAVGSSFSRTDDNIRLLETADLLRRDAPQVARVWAARDPKLHALMDARPDRSASTTYDRALRCVVDSIRARFGAWY